MRLHRPMMLSLALTLIVAVTAGAQSPTTPAPVKKEPDVQYVPTHEKVVAEMLQVAKVNKNDILYDLGSGDGRIVITAAQKFGTRGTGIDIDPKRIEEANENARKAGVADRVTFIEGDLFEADIKDATVVTLYLLPALNLKLRPKLLSELKPGTRIVSHNYDMGDWEPEKTIKVNLPDGVHTVYYWIIPQRRVGS
jgi:predicted O-methyltransferase YrrM